MERRRGGGPCRRPALRRGARPPHRHEHGRRGSAIGAQGSRVIGCGGADARPDQPGRRVASAGDRGRSPVDARPRPTGRTTQPVVAALLDERASMHSKGAPTSSPRWPLRRAVRVGVIANNPLRLGGCLDAVGGEGRPVRADGATRSACRDRARRRGVAGSFFGPTCGLGRSGTRGAPRRRAAATPSRAERGAPGDAGDPQGVRRRLHRDELPSLGATGRFAWPDAEVAVMRRLRGGQLS